MSQLSINELVTVTYKNDVITIKADSFTVTGKLPSSELMQIYWGNTGKGSARVTLDVPEPKPVVENKKPTTKKTIEQIITELAEKGLDEAQIMQTEIELP